ncbi:hypothetical protein EB105725_31_00400 [Shimwellia blattae DSM 4481 = NBRC 105725]|nr:hypothetical protein EB105725_31_00400 [Shimwellia blattae DSM 4481 = NBRC 105725]
MIFNEKNNLTNKNGETVHNACGAEHFVYQKMLNKNLTLVERKEPEIYSIHQATNQPLKLQNTLLHVIYY